MSAVNDILRELPIDQLAAELGTDEQTAQEAVAQAVPLLISGMQNNAQAPEGEQALAGALDEHATRGLLDGGIDLNQVDTADGQKIVRHIFGGQDINSLAGQYGALGGGASGSLIQKLLPILAPIVLAYIAKNLQGKAQQAGGSGSILGDLLGGVLGGGMGGGLGQATQAGYPTQQQGYPQQTQSAGGGILGDLLGGLLGGGAAGGMLGGMFGEDQAQQQGYQQQTQQQAFPQQTQQVPADNGEIRIDDPNSNDSGTAGYGTQQEEEQQSGGGLLGDILGGIFGNGNKR